MSSQPPSPASDMADSPSNGGFLCLMPDGAVRDLAGADLDEIDRIRKTKHALAGST